MLPMTVYVDGEVPNNDDRDSLKKRKEREKTKAEQGEVKHHSL